MVVQRRDGGGVVIGWAEDFSRLHPQRLAG